jgi:hypothetical protein
MLIGAPVSRLDSRDDLFEKTRFLGAVCWLRARTLQSGEARHLQNRLHFSVSGSGGIADNSLIMLAESGSWTQAGDATSGGSMC